MTVTAWGTRGSLTTPGKETVKYGGNTTCIEVRLEDGSLIIIDAGSGIHKLGLALLREKGLKDITLLITHSHWDHLLGFPFFSPAYSRKYVIHVAGGPCPQDCLRRYLAHQMDPPYFPVEFSRLQAEFDFDIDGTRPISVGAGEVVPIPLSHPNGGYGYKIREGGRSFVFLTDNEFTHPHDGGLAREEYVDFCRKVDLLYHDGQYTAEEYKRTKGWGHSTLGDAMHLGIDAGVARLGITHHDPDHRDSMLDREIGRHRKTAARSGLSLFGVKEGAKIRLP